MGDVEIPPRRIIRMHALFINSADVTRYWFSVERSLMEALLQDVRYALRQMRKTKVFSLAVVAALALGLGANIAVFTVLSGILLRPLPYVQPERIVALTGNGTREFCCLSYANLLRLQDALDGKLQVGMTVRTLRSQHCGSGRSLPGAARNHYE